MRPLRGTQRTACKNFAAACLVRQFHTLAGSCENDRVIADNIATADSVHPDLGRSARAHIAEASVPHITVVLQRANIGERLSQHLCGAAWRILFHAVMHLHDFEIEVRAKNLGGLPREPQQRVYAGRVIAGIHNRDATRGFADTRHSYITDSRRPYDERPLPSDARGKNTLQRSVVAEIYARIALRERGGEIIAHVRGRTDCEVGGFFRTGDERFAHAPFRAVDVKDERHGLDEFERSERRAQFCLRGFGEFAKREANIGGHAALPGERLLGGCRVALDEQIGENPGELIV